MKVKTLLIRLRQLRAKQVTILKAYDEAKQAALARRIPQRSERYAK